MDEELKTLANQTVEAVFKVICESSSTEFSKIISELHFLHTIASS